jgi:hypothetical protein
MNEQVFNSKEEFAKFLNLKAKEGYGNIKVAVGAYSVKVTAAALLEACPRDQKFTVTYATVKEGFLGIGDIL